ncbi:zinc ABC transporter substrate-binding protein [Geomonas subterranea]|uniref:Zinc ABC transporter substrate-binding protein n=1 Tax=Geomonas subterranea TaxID=2847989 RepID=A0ABX8LJG6_9BACT|nr:zinc ABC transporter substrate-binding protein [Geomonas subterranea]QXE90504.1 zinc ABC transporter substrate-binding protein [Geomonas subterranea]QXM11419.1 zinc ABC transporter substrate-binding protein [Geomonas subterranea]
MKWLLALLLALLLVVPGCSSEKRQTNGKLQVVTTLFPLYDFARTIGGDRADVTLLLPPGVEPHSFEPRPEDVVRVNRADLFVYTNAAMEPWAANIISGIDQGKVEVVEGGKGIALRQGPVSEQHRGERANAHEGKGSDPHIWLDFDNARAIARNILAAYVARDPRNKTFYQQNAAKLDGQLAALDQRFKDTLARCPKKVLLHGGHYAFGYLARRYGLQYISASAVNADAEPTPAKLAELVQVMRREHLNYVYTEELLSPRLAETIARETGAKVLMLRAGHNVTRDDLQRGVTFISLMEENLQNLKTGLQ